MDGGMNRGTSSNGHSVAKPLLSHEGARNVQSSRSIITLSDDELKRF